MCLSEPEKNTAVSSFQLIHYRPPAGESQSGQTKLFSDSQGHTRGYHVGLVKQTHKLTRTHTRSNKTLQAKKRHYCFWAALETEQADIVTQTAQKTKKNIFKRQSLPK